MSLRILAAAGACALLVSACAPTSSPQSASVVARPAGVNCPGGTLKGEGASSQKIFLEEMVQAYTRICPGTAVEYTSSGSGAGVKAFIGGAVDWAGSDSPLRTKAKDGVVEADQAAKRCGGNPAVNLPMVFGPIAIAYNVDGVDQLNLSPSVIARIFDGQITTWNAPEIAADNPGVTLPAADIGIFYRADESGTTENFTEYLAEATDGAWPHEPAKAWAGSAGEGKEKSAGVAEGVLTTRNSIAYMEWGAALERGLKVAAIDGVTLSGTTASAALEAAEVTGSDGDLRLKLDYTPGDGAYPAVMATYEIVCSTGGTNPDLLRDFLTFVAADQTQAGVSTLGYAPLPPALRDQVAESIAAVR